MWENVATSAVTLVAAVIGALLARGSSRWRRLTTARHELELADAFGSGALSEQLRAKAERTTEKYLRAGSLNPGRALWYARALVLVFVLLMSVVLLIAIDLTFGKDAPWDKFVIVSVGVTLGFWFDPMSERVSKVLIRER